MKYLIFLLALLLGHGTFAQSLTSTERLQRLDALLANPFDSKAITQEAYDNLLYKQQVKLTSLAVQQGKTLGINASADDKGATVNLGTPVIRRHLALQLTGRGAAESGFVSLFADDKYQKTLTGGGTLIYFWRSSSAYKERTKKDLHWKLHQLREKEKASWSSEYVPYTPQKLRQEYEPVCKKFSVAWTAWQEWLNHNGAAEKFYDGDLDLEAFKKADGQTLYNNYLAAEHDMLPILPKQWDAWVGTSGREKERAWVDSLNVPSKFDALMQNKAAHLSEKMRLASAARYDSLQMLVSWVATKQQWISFSGFGNTVKQPIFDATQKASGYAGEIRDNYWQYQAAYNAIFNLSWCNIYISAGGGFSDMRVFNKRDLVTYQTSKKVTGIDSLLTVTQKSLYKITPDAVWRLNWQGQISWAFPGLQNAGLTASSTGLGGGDKLAQNTLTLGIFIPVPAGSSTLIFIPQVRRESIKLPTPWSVGFSFTASIPGLVK